MNNNNLVKLSLKLKITCKKVFQIKSKNIRILKINKYKKGNKIFSKLQCIIRIIK